MNSLDMNRVCRKDISISLSPEERELFSILLQANSELQLNSTLRVAGGWVRDKVVFDKGELSADIGNAQSRHRDCH